MKTQEQLMQESNLIVQLGMLCGQLGKVGSMLEKASDDFPGKEPFQKAIREIEEIIFPLVDEHFYARKDEKRTAHD